MTDLVNHTTSLEERAPVEEDRVLVQPRKITPEQWARFEQYTAEMFAAF